MSKDKGATKMRYPTETIEYIFHLNYLISFHFLSLKLAFGATLNSSLRIREI